jgi:NADH-quinone oxidoreductase subunit J
MARYSLAHTFQSERVIVSAEVLVFNILAVIAVVAALGVVLARNPVHSALSLVVTFVNMAGIFVILRAEFLAAVQIIAYTGAILVLVLFVIMLVRQDDLPDFHGGQPLQRIFGFALGLILLGEIAVAVLTRNVVGQQGPWTEENMTAAGGNVQVIGQVMYSGYVLPVQVTAVILLVGTIAALFLARPDTMPGAARRRTSTISLGHSRGAEVGQLTAGEAAERSSPEHRRGTVRGGIIVVDDAESYTDTPAWGTDTSPRDTDGKKE